MLRVIDLDPLLRHLLSTDAPRSEILSAALNLARDLVDDLLFFGIHRSHIESFTIESLSPTAKA